MRYLPFRYLKRKYLTVVFVILRWQPRSLDSSQQQGNAVLLAPP